uniref:Homeobox domain-containing protein n=1 Tax=Parastrongyloides trichosuri TaxID=131310 RepID=A0A0N4Z497_PARTI
MEKEDSDCKKKQFNHPFSIESLLKIYNPIKSLELFSNKNPSFKKESSFDVNKISNNEEKKRRQRSTFTSTQIRVLEYEFMNSRYISTEHRSRLANFLGISEQQIKIWFQNRRYKTKLLYLSKNNNQSNSNIEMKEQDNFIINNDSTLDRQHNLMPIFNVSPMLQYNVYTKFLNDMTS